MTAAKHGNGPDPDRVKQCVERIEALDREREAAHMEYMNAASQIAARKKDVFTEAKSAWGIATRPLKSVIKARAAERKLEALRGDLEGDDQDAFDQIRHALGDLADTPLGEAATAEKAEKAKARGKKTDALNMAAENAARLAGGISQLPN